MSSKFDIGIITVLPEFELPAVLHQFGCKSISEPSYIFDGCRYWDTRISAKFIKSDLSVIITSIGPAGNPDASAATTNIIKEFHTRFVFLVGIAAGIKDETYYGDIIVSEKVFGYEKAKLLKTGIAYRPDNKVPTFSIISDARYFSPFYDQEGISSEANEYLLTINKNQRPPRNLIPKNINVNIASIASGEKIFGDGSLIDLKKRFDDKIKAGEMEGLGFAIAADRHKNDWLIVRGISDFGDPLSKDGRLKDKFHHYASFSAARFLYHFIKNGLSNSFQHSENESEIQLFENIPPLKINNVLFSVYNKNKIEEPLEYFSKNSIGIIATANTHKIIKSLGYTVKTTLEYTNTEPLSIMRGTLHPYVLASIMASSFDKDKVIELKRHNLETIDLVFINSHDITLYDKMKESQIINQLAELQIGGPGLLRWTLKHWRAAAAVVDPDDYSDLILDLAENNNILSNKMRIRLLRRAMQYIEYQDQRTSKIFKLLWASIG